MPAPTGFSLSPSGFYYKTDGSGPYWLDANGAIRTLFGELVDALTGGWSYSPPANGITNSSAAVTIKAAAGVGIINYMTSIQISSDPLGSGTEFLVRNGAAGPVLWRAKMNTAGMSSSNILLSRPIASSSNTLLEIVTSTPTLTGGVFFNAQGYSA